MNRRTRAALAALVLLLVVGCGQLGVESGPGGVGAGGGGPAPQGPVIAFLMPDLASTRYEQFDAPLFTARVAMRCPRCRVLYRNAAGDAGQQQDQARAAIEAGARVLVLSAVDTAGGAQIVQAAKAVGVSVVTYDRPLPSVRTDYYVSYDNELIGRLIARGLVDQLHRTGSRGGLLLVNGSPTDAAAGLIKSGMHQVVDTAGFPVLAEYDTPGWAPARAQQFVATALRRFPGQVAGVAAANDGTGGGAIAAFKAAQLPVPPVTGNDAELAALRRILSGEQFSTISKPLQVVAEAAADVADTLASGGTPTAPTSLFDTPAQLFRPTFVTLGNLAAALRAPGSLTVAQICTPAYAAACARIGLTAPATASGPP